MTARTIERRFALLAGATLPCVLLTAIDSSAPGLVTCSLTQDVLSDDGSVVLLEKGSRVLGAYQQKLNLGDQRLHVVWTRAVTPNGVAIELQSPAADALGRSGLDGELDSRFWERFGGAVLLSIVDTGQTTLVARSDQIVAFPPSEARERTLSLPPRLRVPQGEEITIFVAHDLDFRGVYELHLR